MYYSLNHRFSILAVALVAVTMMFTACSDSGTGGNDEAGNLKTGFIISAQTPSGTYLAKYFEEFPSGTVDMSDGTDFQNFFPVDSYDGALFMARTDGSAGFSKVVVNSNGEIVEDGILPTVDESSFRIKVRDENTGVYHDRNTPSELTVFNPSDMSVSGTIDMSAGLAPAPQRYESFYFRGDLVFAPIRPNQGGTFDSTIVHVANVSSGSYVGSTSLNSGQSLTVSGFGQRSVAEDGTIYLPDIGNPTGANPISSVLRIPAGSDEIDASYDFTPALVANPSNTLLSVSNGFFYHQNHTAYALVATEIPQELLELVASVGGNPANLSQEQIQQALGILYSAENGQWSQLDLQAQTVTPLPGFPSVSPFITYVVTEFDSKLYFPVITSEVNAVFEFDPSTNQSQKAFDVEGGSLIGVYNLSNNN